MKILEPGKVEETWTIRHRCTGWGNGDDGCEALLEVEREDLRYYEGQELPWRTSEPAVCFKCPCCNKLTDLGLNNWPKNYRSLERWTSEWCNENPSTKSAAA